MTPNQGESLMGKNKYVTEPVGHRLSTKKDLYKQGYINPIHSHHDKGVQHKY